MDVKMKTHTKNMKIQVCTMRRGIIEGKLASNWLLGSIATACTAYQTNVNYIRKINA